MTQLLLTLSQWGLVPVLLIGVGLLVWCGRRDNADKAAQGPTGAASEPWEPQGPPTCEDLCSIGRDRYRQWKASGAVRPFDSSEQSPS